MANDCTALPGDDFVFPRRPLNRPALDTIAYRIGAYPEFAEYLTRRINQAVELRAWTHRTADDPGIALLQAAAILGDILTFYQERYANEAYLRTAKWRESVADLVRLTGYRLAPGVGGAAVFAFEVKGDKPTVIPAGFPLKADLEDLDKPAEFQTEADLTAHAHLSRFHLYRPRTYATGIEAGDLALEVRSVDGVTGPDEAAAVNIKPGDRLVLLPPEPGWATTGGSLAPAQKTPQVVKVKGVRKVLDRTLLDLEAPIAEDWSSGATAYRLGRSFRHFGHNAPETYTVTSKGADGKVDGANLHDTDYLRDVSLGSFLMIAPLGFPAPRVNPFYVADMVPLDQEVSDLLVGGQVLVQTRVQDPDGVVRPLASLRTIEAAQASSLSFSALTGSSTVLTLDEPLMRSGRIITGGLFAGQIWPFKADVRDCQVHEVTSPPLALGAPARGGADAFTDGNQALCFFGTEQEARTLAGRRLVLADGGGRLTELSCTSLETDFVLAEGQHEPRPWTLSFDKAPAPFTRADFDEAGPTVTVYGNLADATQGKAEAETVIGNGDARASFQTFKLPKKPLTYLLSTSATPPQVPELEVRVNGRLWSRVDSLFGLGPADENYIVREDAQGASYVQFGDGETGARLPSGVGNVTAAYRTGNGARGAVKAGATPSAGSRVAGLDKVRLPVPVSGGDEPESTDKARLAAPGKVQGLGRLVSLADYETETLSIPGVTAAAAAWGLRDGVPALGLRVLMEAKRESEFAAVRDTIQSWQRCRGPDRFPVVVEQAFLRYLWLDVTYAGDPRLARADLEAALKSALGLAGVEADRAKGIFGLRRRRLGEPEYVTGIEGALQRVEGIDWCRVTALGLFPPNDPDVSGDDDPATLALPPAPRSLAAVVTPTARELLQLAEVHLTLTPAAQAPKGECA